MAPHPLRAAQFFYDGYTIDPEQGLVTCTYTTGGHTFTERYHFDPKGDWESPAVEAAVRLLFLLAGVSYYKTTAATVIEIIGTTTTANERAFLLNYYINGLGEFAYRNGINMATLTITGPDHTAKPYEYLATPGRPLIPFGGGIDSIVTVSALASRTLDSSLCIVHPPGERFAAIEEAAAVTGLPITRIERALDAQVRRSDELGFFNGHVPITAVVTAASLVAAVLARRDAVILSNEWSASIPTLIVEGLPVNHQWSKGGDFEQDFAQIVREALGPHISVFSYLRPRSELWVAQQFAELTDYHGVFRSCNRAFHQDPAERMDRWCGECDKCCFIDLILAPFMSPDELSAVFSGSEPLSAPENITRFRRLLGLEFDAKPFECVGDIGECRAAALLTSDREDRKESPLVQQLRREIAALPVPITIDPETLLNPVGPHFVPERYAPPDLLVATQ